MQRNKLKIKLYSQELAVIQDAKMLRKYVENCNVATKTDTQGLSATAAAEGAVVKKT